MTADMHLGPSKGDAQLREPYQISYIPDLSSAENLIKES